MLKETLGDVRMDRGLLITDNSVHPKAPGMKYRHYAPKETFLLWKGTEEQVIGCINRLSAEAEQKGLKVGVIATNETKDRYAHADVFSIGRQKKKKRSHIIFMKCFETLMMTG